MLSLLISILGIIITLLVVIGVHEYGHFIVARLCGIKVICFSLGFGKKLVGWHDKKGTEYLLSVIPLGGYVKMLDESESDVPPDQIHLTYNQQSLFKRMAVVIAGPLSNILFALVLYWIIFMIGFTTMKPIIGSVKPHSIAERAGLSSQQEILQVDNHPTLSWYGVLLKILLRAGDTNTMHVETQSLHSDKKEMHTLFLSDWKMDDLKPDPLDSIGIIPYSPEIPAVIDYIREKSPAALANLHIGDKIIAIDNIPIHEWSDIPTKVLTSYGKILAFTVERQNKRIVIPVTIGTERDIFFNKHGILGVSPKIILKPELLRKNQYGVLEAFTHAWYETSDFVSLNFIFIGKMLLGKISLKSIGGPITIFESAGSALNLGILPFLSFLAFLSIAVGVINIIPVPGLDGGHFLFQIVELVTRKPLSQRTQLLLYRLGLALLFVLIIQAISNDIMRL